MRKRIIYIIGIIYLTGCSVYKPDSSSLTNPDYNKRVNVSNAHFDKVLTPIGVGSFIVGTAAGGYIGYSATENSNYFAEYNGTEKKNYSVAGGVVGAFAGFTATYLLNKAFGWGNYKKPSNPNEWIKKANKNFLLVQQTDATNFTIMHKTAESKYLAKNIQDAKDFSVAFPNSQYTNNVCKQTINNSNFSRDNYFELLNLFPGNRYELDMKKKYVWYSPTVSSLFTAYDKFPETKLDIEFKGADLVSDYYDAKIFHNRFPKSIYNRKVVVKSLDNSSVSNIEKMAPMFGNDFYLTKYDFQKYSASVSNIGKKNYSNALFEIKNPNTMLKLEGFYHQYSWLKYTEKPEEILNNYWYIGNRTLSNGNDILGFINNLATNRSYNSWNISNSKVNNFLKKKLGNEINRKVSYSVIGITGANDDDWSRWLNNNNLTAGYVKQNSVGFLIYGNVRNNSKFDLPIKMNINASLYAKIKVQGTGFWSNLAVWGMDAVTNGNFSENTEFKGKSYNSFYIPNLKKNETQSFAVLLDYGSYEKLGFNILDTWKVTQEIFVKKNEISLSYNNYNISKSTLNEQNYWLSLAKNGMPDVKLIDGFRRVEYNDETWKQKWEWKKEQERLAAERRRREREREYDNYEKNYAEEERKKEEEREQALQACINECINEVNEKWELDDHWEDSDILNLDDCPCSVWHYQGRLFRGVDAIYQNSKGEWYYDIDMHFDDGKAYKTKAEVTKAYCRDICE